VLRRHAGPECRTAAGASDEPDLPRISQWWWRRFACGVSTILLARAERLPIGPNTLLINSSFFSIPCSCARLSGFFSACPEKLDRFVALSAVMVVAVVFSYVRPDPNVRVFLLSLISPRSLPTPRGWLAGGQFRPAAVKWGLIANLQPAGGVESPAPCRWTAAIQGWNSGLPPSPFVISATRCC